MKQLVLFFLLLVGCRVQAQEGTTFILVRHAEKAQDDPKNPSLSEAGNVRSVVLARLLEKTPVQSIYSTDFKRTRSTVQPLAEQKNVEIQVYPVQSQTELAAEWKVRHAGETVVICGHSNTIPQLANALLGENRLHDFEDTDYGNLLIVFVDGLGNSHLLHLRF